MRVIHGDETRIRDKVRGKVKKKSFEGNKSENTDLVVVVPQALDLNFEVVYSLINHSDPINKSLIFILILYFFIYLLI